MEESWIRNRMLIFLFGYYGRIMEVLWDEEKWTKIYWRRAVIRGKE